MPAIPNPSVRAASLRFAGALLAIAGAPALASDNLLRDAGFDLVPGSTGSPWTVSGSGSVSRGYGGYLGNGLQYTSARLTAGDGAQIAIAQCVSVWASSTTEFILGTQFFATLGGAGFDSVTVAPYLDSHCSDPVAFVGPGVGPAVGIAPREFGFLRQSGPFQLPEEARSVEVRIAVSADPGATRVIDWDAVRLVALNPLDAAPQAHYWHQDIADIADTAEVDDGFGTALASGDFDGDGYDDLAIGVPEEDRSAFGTDYIDAGLVNVVYGGGLGLDAFASQALGAQPFAGLQGGARVGAALAAADIDGDGHDDLVIGAPGSHDDGATSSGAIYVSYGSPDGLVGFARMTQASPQIGNNSEANDRFGASLSAGDIDGDGYADVVVGTPGESVGSSGADSGAVYVLYGSAEGLQGASAPHGYQVLHQGSPGVPLGTVGGNQFGHAVLLHDVDSDGADDLVVGVPFEDQTGIDAGAVYVLFSRTGTIDSSFNALLLPTQFGEAVGAPQLFFGAALAGGEMQRPDLHRTVLIGAPGNSVHGVTGHGRVYRYAVHWEVLKFVEFDAIEQGPTPPESPEAFDQFGAALVTADLDGDGRRDDDVAGAPGEDVDAGSVHVLTPIERALRQSSFGGAHEFGDRLGAAFARGNFNGRGADELAIAVPEEGVGSVADAGSVVELGWDPPLASIFRNGFEDPN